MCMQLQSAVDEDGMKGVGLISNLEKGDDKIVISLRRDRGRDSERHDEASTPKGMQVRPQRLWLARCSLL